MRQLVLPPGSTCYWCGRSPHAVGGPRYVEPIEWVGKRWDRVQLKAGDEAKLPPQTVAKPERKRRERRARKPTQVPVPNRDAKLRQIDAARRFAQRYGRPPSAADWNPAQARAKGHTERAERFYRDGDYPRTSTVQTTWGSWNALIQAAGFEPMTSAYPRGGHSRDDDRRGLHLVAERQRGWRRVVIEEGDA
jgi:Homing endonuclease associated repeat